MTEQTVKKQIATIVGQFGKKGDDETALFHTCSLTTIGVIRLSSLAAAMIPSAITSHLMMPPNMFTNKAFT